MIVNNLLSFRKDFALVINLKLIELVFNFTIDLYLLIIDKYVSKLLSIKLNLFFIGFEYNRVDYRLYLN